MAKLDGASRVLGTRIVTVNTAGGLPVPVRAGRLQALVVSSLASLPPDVKNRLKGPSVSVTIDAAGVHVRVVSEVEVDNFPNPTVTIALTIGVGASGGFITTRLLASNIAVDFPWWVHFVPPIVSEFIQGRIIDRITGQIQGALPGLVARAAAEANATVSLPPDYGIWSVTPSSGLLTVLIFHR